MLVWLLMLLSIIAVWLLLPDVLSEKKKKLIFLVFAFVVLVIILGSRSEYAASSGDVYGYLKWYRRAIALPMSSLLEYEVMEKGYLILNDVLAWLIPWDRFILYFQAAFCTSVFFWYIYRNVDNVLLAVMVYICMGPWQFFLTAFRQSIAISICIIALELMKKEKISSDVWALVMVVLATTIHTTAWLFLLAFIIRRVKLGKGFVVFCVLSVLTVSLVIDDLIVFANDTLGRDYDVGGQFGNIFGGLIPILIYVATCILCYLAWMYDKSFTDDYGLEIKMLALGLCLYAFRYNTTIFERISFYFTPVVSVLLPVAIERQKLKSERVVISAITIGLCIALFCYRCVQQFGEYEFYWA